MSLATALVNSRKFTPDPAADLRIGPSLYHLPGTVGTTTYDSPVADLVRQIEVAAEARGLTLSRWQTNGAGRKVMITWAVHRGERKAQFRRMNADDVIASMFLHQLEGTSQHCEAYRELSHLLQVVEAQ